MEKSYFDTSSESCMSSKVSKLLIMQQVLIQGQLYLLNGKKLIVWCREMVFQLNFKTHSVI